MMLPGCWPERRLRGLLFARFWIFSILYAIWWYVDRAKPWQGGRQSDVLRHWVIWRYMKDCFPISTPSLLSPSTAALIPIFSFGENDIYEQVQNSPGSWLRWFQDRPHKSTRGSIPLFYSRGVFQFSFGLMPCHRPITTVVEKPIEVQKTPHRSQEEVDRLHQRYMKELENLFEAHKLKNNVSID
ncbi:hypothetical protein MG293_012255 [Ovis ammon polii]|uniref:Uncharacterized protein n=1 Tax=Ovis ammon polii TaxID=230172 RepID=A0AAD4U090_OVIAM|nr:hypothetical protein MG293_012255 [Ovis ammon polii]